MAQQHLHDALDHLHHVGLALAQVGVLDGLELPTSCSICCTSAHSALARRVRINASAASTSIGSSRNMMCMPRRHPLRRAPSRTRP